MSIFGWLLGDKSEAYDAGVERAKRGSDSALSLMDRVTLYDGEKKAQQAGFEHGREALTHAEIIAERLAQK
jgi:hypothetical protein